MDLRVLKIVINYALVSRLERHLSYFFFNN